MVEDFTHKAPTVELVQILHLQDKTVFGHGVAVEVVVDITDARHQAVSVIEFPVIVQVQPIDSAGAPQ